MPLEITEVFSMAPLSGTAQSTEYVVPVGFNMGVGHVLRSQQQLLAKFEDLASEYNTYSEAEGKAAFFGQDMFKETLDESMSNIRGIRDAAVSLMKAIYSEGHEPLPPEKRLDRNIATILEDRLMASAARSNDHAESGSTVETMGVTNAASSANAVARALPLSTKFLINCRDDRL